MGDIQVNHWPTATDSDEYIAEWVRRNCGVRLPQSYYIGMDTGNGTDISNTVLASVDEDGTISVKR